MTIVTALDTETTGLSAEKGHSIIEIALISFDLEKGEEVNRFTTMINPLRPIDEKASAVHGIYASDLKDYETFKHYEPQITEILESSDYFVIHNAEFDLGFLISEYSKIKKELIDRPVVDTMIQGRFASFWGKVPTLSELCFAARVEFDESKAHGAIYDTEKLMEVFLKCYPRHFTLDIK